VIVKATLNAAPTNFEGLAPALINFQGTIEVIGATAPTTVQYRFMRSDGALARPTALRFPAGDSKQSVTTSWKMAPAAYSGWVAIEVTYPKHILSNQAAFSVKCLRTDLALVNAVYKVNESKHNVAFAAAIRNVGDVDVSGPFKVIIGAGIGLFTEQSTIQIPAGTVIPKGSQYTTPFAAEQELYYNVEYWVDMILDPDRQLRDINRHNDRYQTKYVVWRAAPVSTEAAAA
jgi:hypothetical protein